MKKWDIWGKVKGAGKTVLGKVYEYNGAVKVVALGVAGSVAAKVYAAESLIPEMPVDFRALTTEAAIIVGEVMAGVAGLTILIALIIMGYRTIRAALGGR